MVKNFLIFLIYFWHSFLVKLLSQILAQPVNCRFYPSCSAYTSWAIKKFGIITGIRLGILRILACHPFGKFGIDLLK